MVPNLNKLKIYETEIRGWKEQEEVERVQEKYIFERGARSDGKESGKV
jgi:hypothetical protein